MEEIRRVDRGTDARPVERLIRIRSAAARAFFLHELLATPPVSSDRAAAGAEVEAALARWALAFAAGDAAALARRLAWDGIDPVVAARVFSLDPSRTDPDPESRATPWVDTALETGLLDSDSTDAFAPALVRFATAMAQQVERLVPASAAPPRAELERLANRLARDLAAFSRRADEEFRSESVADENRAGDAWAFYERFPMLLRLSVLGGTQWRDGWVEMLARLAVDRAAIEHRFGGTKPLGDLVGIERLESDRHGGGRVVHRLAFAGGTRLVYKPRSVALEDAYSSFVGWARASGLEETPPAAAVLSRAEYGWMSFVEPEEASGEAEVERYFRRAGALLAIAELLGAEDLHAENLIATREGPVVIDAEMFLQPIREGAEPSLPTLFASGLLARASAGPGDRAAHRAGLAPLEGVPLGNAIRCAGVAVAPESRRIELAAGFESAYRFLLARGDELGAANGPLAPFRDARVRVLERPTQSYGVALAALAAPRAARDGREAGLLFEALLRPFAEQTERPRLWALVAAERRALERLDVPRFEVPAAATVVEAEGIGVAGLFARSGFAAVRDRLAAWGSDHLAEELAALDDALAPEPWRQALAAAAERAGGDREELAFARRFRGAAAALVDEIARFELENARAHAARSPATSPAARLVVLSLYDGAVGRGLFLAAAGRQSIDATRDALSSILRGARAVLEACEPLARDAELPLGGLNGVGGVVWGLVWIARLARLDEALELASRAIALAGPERIAADRRFDLEGGAAGLLLAALALEEASGDVMARAVARDAARHLLSHRTAIGGGVGWRRADGRALAGSAHGAAGIARSLAAFERAEGPAALRAAGDCSAAVAGALAFERALFDPARGNWPVMLDRVELGEARRSWMNAWCHGAPGIALARAFMPESYRDRSTMEEIEVGLATLEAGLLDGLDHLCCAAAGRLSSLATAGSRLGVETWRSAARAGGAKWLARMVAQPRGPALPAPDRDPARLRRGLFRGLAGVGYALLELADEAIPSPLALELPSELASRHGARP